MLEDKDGKPLDVYYLPERAHIEVAEGATIAAGTVVAKTPREASGIKDITGGLPRVTEIFEARKPKDPAVIAEVDGVVEILGEKRRGKRTIIVRSESGIEREHLVPPGKRFLVHAGDHVRAGQALVDGPLVPHDILRISGEEAVQQYLLHEIQGVYRSQRVEINDKHCEIIIARMLRKVKIENPGDTNLLPGSVMDRFDFRQANESLSKCLKISQHGDSEFAEDAIVPREALESVNSQIEALGRNPGQGHAAPARHRQYPVAGHHQSRGPKLQLHLRRQLPGNDEGADRGRFGRQDRPTRRTERKRDSGTPDPGGDRLPDFPRSGSSDSARSTGQPGRGERSSAGDQLPAAGVRTSDRRRQQRSGRGNPAAEPPLPDTSQLDALFRDREEPQPQPRRPHRHPKMAKKIPIRCCPDPKSTSGRGGLP